MLNAICPAIYRQLRIRTGMTQEEFGAAIGCSRRTVARFESGCAQPDEKQEKKMLELARCTREELAEMVCAEVSAVIGKRVGIDESEIAYKPTTELARAYALLERHLDEISPPMVRALQNDIDATQLMGLAFESKRKGLKALTRECQDELG